MSVVSVLGRVSRDQMVGLASGALAVGSIVVVTYAGPAFAVTCSTRNTYIGQGFNDLNPVIQGTASNKCGSNNSHEVSIRVRRNDTIGTDDTIASASFYISTSASSSYTRSTQGCRKGQDKYHADQKLNGGQEKRSPKDEDRTFKDCYKQ